MSRTQDLGESDHISSSIIKGGNRRTFILISITGLLKNNRWDEWVPASRLLKLNEENSAIQKSLQAQANPQTSSTSSSKHGKSHGGVSGSKDASTSRAGVRKDGTRGTKRGREEVTAFYLFFGSSLFITHVFTTG